MSFNAADYMENSGGIVAILEGWNELTVKEITQKISRAGNSYTEITLSGEEGGRVWMNLNINHPNPKADEIARRDLAKLMIACDCNSVMSPENPAELIGKSFQGLIAKDGTFIRVQDFKPSKNKLPGRVVNSDEFPNDDIPF